MIPSLQSANTLRLPALIGGVLRPLPLFPLERFLNLVLKAVLARHPDLFSRMGAHAGTLFLIELTDMPFLAILDADSRHPAIRLHRKKPHEDFSATITGPILSHLKMLTGRLDGDALFFSRDISISGDTEAVLALRNAVDNLNLGRFFKKKEIHEIGPYT